MSRRPAWRVRDDENQLWLVGLRLGLTQSAADVFTIVVGALDDSPLIHEGQMILFSRPAVARAALSMDTRPAVAADADVPEKVYATLDVQDAWRHLQERTTHIGGGVVDVLNFILDSLKAVEIDVPQEHMILLRLADHLTFSGDYAGFLSESGMTPKDVARSFSWAAWSLAMKSIFVAD